MYLIDVHSHILHNIDDGAKNIDISIEMLTESFNQGVRKLILTPHFDDYLKCPVDTFLAKRERRFLELKNEIEKRNAEVPELYLGAEVGITSDLSEVPEIEKLTIGNTNYILLEMPYTIWNDWVFDSIFKLITVKKVIPIIAHIERYFGLINPKKIIDLSQMELYFQVNADSITDKKQLGNVLRLINNDLVYFLGSDAHSLKSRPSMMKQAAEILENKVSKEYAQYLMINSNLMLDNKFVERADDVNIPKGRLSTLNKLLYGKI